MNITIHTEKLDQLVTAYRNKATARVGIIDKNSRHKGTSKNAEIGAVHEFGSTKVPKRSFLRTPILENLPNKINAEKTKFSMALTEGNIKQIVEIAAVEAKDISQGAFDTQGYGKWQADKEGGKPLVKTGQLRDSITYEVS